ncbi:MAG: NYN domain-containing protein [Coriobacteriia bacterium]|nr:NYN domain-containing protein [Coriobacteriia bacterium]
MSDNKKLLIVDGYNVIRATDHYRSARDSMPDYGDEAYNSAREALINDVAVFAGSEYQAVIVFDGAGNPFSDGKPTNYGRIEVIFSQSGSTADSVIERRVHQASERGYEVLVVTSDATTQWTVLGHDITRMSAAGFVNEIKSLQYETTGSSYRIAEKNTLGERIPEETLKELKDRFG